MKLLLFSDLHADTSAAERLVRLAGSVDLVVGAGDFGNARRNLAACVDVLRRIDRPAILVPGNNESYDELVSACRGWSHAKVLHGAGIQVQGVSVFGLGGGVPVTPFGPWSWDFTEADAERLLAGCPRNAVLVSHSPPKSAVDVSSTGRSLGSTAVRDAVLRLEPRLVVCGHIHASGGETTSLGGSPVVNAGPAGVFWDL